MMRFRFTGEYTNKHISVDIRGVTFVGHEPVTVTDVALIAKLMRHPELTTLPEVSGVATIPVDEAPKRRGRPRKVPA